MTLTPDPFVPGSSRSSHTSPVTIQSGGIIFYLAALVAFSVDKLNQPYFFIGLTAVALISFWDDLNSRSIRSRIITQFAYQPCYDPIGRNYLLSGGTGSFFSR